MTITYIAFEGTTCIAQGLLTDVAAAAKRAIERPSKQPVLIFNAASGEQTDLDLHGSEEEVIARLTPSAIGDAPIATSDALQTSPRTAGRPRLGVIPREVTLLPRHWDWLAGQPGGASVALRKLVEQGMRSARVQDRAREMRDAAYRFMHAMAGNERGFEEASRALFATNKEGFHTVIQGWPEDVRRHVKQMADLFFDTDRTSSA